MKHNAMNKIKALCGMVVMLTLIMVGITSVSTQAVSSGIYLATATPHYRNPQTGVIEDSGGEGSDVLGQSMTESATYNKALVEVDDSGNVYVTIRLQLMDNIRNPQFQVNGQSAAVTLMQEDYTNNTADYRMKVKSVQSVIRCKMNVIAMGRDVIFFITVSDLQSGSGDFITSITVNKPTQVNNQPQPSGNNSNNSQQTNNQAVNTVNEPATQPATSQVQGNPSDNNSNNAGNNTETTAEAVTKEITKEQETTTEKETETTPKKEEVKKADKSTEIMEYDESGNEVKTLASSKDKKDSKNTAETVIIVIVVVVIIAAASVGGFYFYKKRKVQNEEQCEK